MIIVVAIVTGVLFASGTYLVLQRTLTRIVLGLTTISNGANLLLMLAGGRGGNAPFVGGGARRRFADPMPQAMALTSIVINFAMLGFLLALAYRSRALTGIDEVEDDIEDRRIARSRREEQVPEEMAADLAEEKQR